MHNARIGIFGASGYSGVELTRLLAAHPQLAIAFLASERHVGTEVEPFTGVRLEPGVRSYVDAATGLALAEGCAAVLLATPADVSLALAGPLLERGIKVVDLSGAFRLEDGEVFRTAYRQPPAPKGLLRQAVYGLPELFREQVRGASLVANPGCYPTAALLGLAPLLSRGLISAQDLVVSAMSGVSGAGRKSGDEYSFMGLSGDARAYKVLGHQHTPEISQQLSKVAAAQVDLTFTPHLIPVPRGILSTAYARRSGKAATEDLTEALRDAYRDQTFIRVVDEPSEVSLHKVVGTNQCWLSVVSEPADAGRVVVVSALDNLLKGAAGQALQNLNLLLGLEETAGLTSLRRFHS